jgi:hypothetical protein
MEVRVQLGTIAVIPERVAPSVEFGAGGDP